MTAARAAWPRTVRRRRATRLIFLDETGFTTNMTRTHGYAPRGERLDAAAPAGHWRSTTFVGGLTADGFIAPMVLDGPMTGAAFVAYVDQVLAPEARPGDLLILDNLACHKTPAARAALARHGIDHLYLPPYSPDRNPIENAFSKLKRLARAAGERTVDGLWAGIGRWIDRFTPEECRNYFRHCGCPATNT